MIYSKYTNNLHGRIFLKNRFYKMNRSIIAIFFSCSMILIKVFWKKKIAHKKSNHSGMIVLEEKNTVFISKFRKNVGNFFNSISTVFGRKNFFNMKTGTNFFFTLIFPSEKIFSLNSFNISIIFGSEFFGLGEVFLFRNRIEVSNGFGGVFFYIFRFFPYNFRKKINFFIKYRFFCLSFFHPTLILISNKSGFLKIFMLSKKKKDLFFLNKIGTKKNLLPRIMSIDFTTIRGKLFLSIIIENKILNFTILFGKNKNLIKIQLIAKLKYHGSSSMNFLIWGQGFNRLLFTGDTDGKIFVWNNLLFPIVYISNPGLSVSDLGSFSFSHSFFTIFKKNQLKIRRHKGKEMFKFLPHVILKNFRLKKFPSKTLNFLTIKFCFTIKKRTQKIFDYFKRFYLELEEDIYLAENLLFWNRIILNMCEQMCLKKIRVTFFRYIFLKFKKINLKIFDKTQKFYFNKIKQLFYLKNIGKYRKLSKVEIQLDQSCKKFSQKNANYKKCRNCKRIFLIKICNMRNFFRCPYFHKNIIFYSFRRIFFYGSEIKQKLYPSLNLKLKKYSSFHNSKISYKKEINLNYVFQKNNFWINPKEF